MIITAKDLSERASEAYKEFLEAMEDYLSLSPPCSRRVYLSGSMSLLPREVWRSRFRKAQLILELCANDVEVVNPAETLIARHPWLYRLLGYRLTLWYDLRLLRSCHFICMVDDKWTTSRGARLERRKALEWGIMDMELPQVLNK